MLESVVQEIAQEVKFTARMTEYFRALLTNKTRGKIAFEMDVSDNALNFAYRQICAKLKVSGRAGIMAYVIKRMEEKANDFVNR